LAGPTAWQFEPLDDEAFPAVRLARAVGSRGGTYPAVYNASNEECVSAFLAGRIGFLDIVDTVERVVGSYVPQGEPDLAGVLAADAWARARARELVSRPVRIPSVDRTAEGTA
jgi:1-deoxy-D-xylulose-5-phosphate reductoisomerase